jgi:hypothetical protein
LTEIIEQDAAVGNHHTQVLAKQIVKKLDDALTDRPAPADVAESAEQGPAVWNVVEASKGMGGWVEPAPTEQTGGEE